MLSLRLIDSAQKNIPNIKGNSRRSVGPKLAAPALSHSFLLSQKERFMSVSAHSLCLQGCTTLVLKVECHIFQAE